MKLSQVVFGLFWLLTLIPLSVDQTLSLTVRDYHVRIQYLGFFLILCTWIWQYGLKRFIAEFVTHLKEPSVRCFLLMGAVGFCGVYLSSYRQRSSLFLGWSIGTLTLVPWIMKLVRKELGEWVVRSVVFYALIQAIVVIVDAAICVPSEGKLHIGRVMVYSYVRGQSLCRPSAWYQEPGYFSLMGLLTALLARVTAMRQAGYWRNFFLISTVVILVAICLSLSRMGWAGVALFAAWELFRLGKGKDALQIRWTNSVKALVAAPFAVLLIFAFSHGSLVYRYLGVFKTDESFYARFLSTRAAIGVFQRNPWVGVGPGTAGAYVLDQARDLHPGIPEYMRWKPLSQNLYTELLSEWGSLGTLAFFLGFFLMFKEIHWRRKVILFALVAIIWSSNQTLPRFDFWLLVGLLKEELV